MGAQHTLGPWEYGTRDDGFEKSSLCTIYNVPVIATEDGKGRTYAYVSAHAKCFEISAAENEANGRLIAAAPDLFAAADEALNTLIGCCVPAGGCDDRKHILNAQAQLRAAIAKATEA